MSILHVIVNYMSKIIYLCAHRFVRERCSMQAAGLTFYTIFALVPLAAFALSLVGSVNIIPDQVARIQTFFITHFVPPFTAEIEHDFEAFIAASGKLSRVSSIFFLLTAFFLVMSIESCFNQIWRIGQAPWPWSQRITAYFMVLVVSPICLSLSVALSAILLSSGWLQHPLLLSGVASALKYLPFVLTWLGIAVLYYWLPHRHVTLKCALYASFITAVLFELMKFGLKLYIIFFPTYKIVYGALSLLPIFLLWIYLSWMAVLFGALLASQMQTKQDQDLSPVKN
jgi:membrane protein